MKPVHTVQSLKLEFVFVVFALFCFAEASHAQFPKIPKIPKITKPETTKTTDSPPAATGISNGSERQSDTAKSNQGSARSRSKPGQVYGPVKPGNSPQLIWDSVRVQASTHSSYWKTPTAKTSSWVPFISFNTFYAKDVDFPHTVEYFNPDGSLWFSEKLTQGWLDGASMADFKSDSTNTNKLRDEISTNGVGTYGFKIKDGTTGATVFEGKYKVGKFLPPSKKGNDVMFFVDHDWRLQFGSAYFHYSNFLRDDNSGGFELYVDMWFKQNLSSSGHGLEAQIFYQGKQVGTTAKGGAVMTGSEHAVDSSNFVPELHHWRQWVFRWDTVRVDNAGGYNPDNYPGSIYIDENPGEYTVKVLKNGTLVREAKFEVGADGRLINPKLVGSGYLDYHRVILPITVTPNAEKWSPANAKSEAFYGNPIGLN